MTIRGRISAMRPRHASGGRPLVVLVVALFASIPLAPSMADDRSQPSLVGHVYDTHQSSWDVLYTTTERGPPASHAPSTADNAVDRRPHGASARPDTATPGSTTTYTTPVEFARIAVATGTTLTGVGADLDDLSSLSDTRSAAEAATNGGQPPRKPPNRSNLGGIDDGDGEDDPAANSGRALSKYDADFALGQITSGGRASASQLDEFGAAQGWIRSQTATGPVKYTDANGIVRLTIKRGSPRAPGSGGPHVELRNADGFRVDPYGNLVTRRSVGNHTPIEWDW